MVGKFDTVFSYHTWTLNTWYYLSCTLSLLAPCCHLLKILSHCWCFLGSLCFHKAPFHFPHPFQFSLEYLIALNFNILLLFNSWWKLTVFLTAVHYFVLNQKILGCIYPFMLEELWLIRSGPQISQSEWFVLRFTYIFLFTFSHWWCSQPFLVLRKQMFLHNYVFNTWKCCLFL